MKVQRAASREVLLIFQALLVLLRGRTAKDASWFDCRDVVCHPDFDLGMVDLDLVGEARRNVVKKKVSEVGKTVDDVRRGSEVAAELLEWLCEVCKLGKGGDTFVSSSPTNVPIGNEISFDYK